MSRGSGIHSLPMIASKNEKGSESFAYNVTLPAEHTYLLIISQESGRSPKFHARSRALAVTALHCFLRYEFRKFGVFEHVRDIEAICVNHEAFEKIIEIGTSASSRRYRKNSKIPRHTLVANSHSPCRGHRRLGNKSTVKFPITLHHSKSKSKRF